MGFLDSIGGIGGLGTVISGVSALAGLGGKTPTYGSSGDLSAGRGYLSQENGIGNQYGQQGQNALTSYGADNGAYRGAAENYAKYLSQDPYTDSYSTAKLAAGSAGSSDAYNRARANLQSTASGMGIGGGAGSMLSGGMAGIDAAQAGQMSGQQNQLALQAIAQHRQNMGQLTDMYGGMAGTDYSRGMGALGAEQGIDQSLSGSYLGMGQREQDMELQAQQAQNQAFGSSLGNIGSIFGSKSGYGAMGGYGGNSGGFGGNAPINPALQTSNYPPGAFTTPNGFNYSPIGLSPGYGGGLGSR